MGNCLWRQLQRRGCKSCLSQSWLSVSLYSTFRLLSQTNVANLIIEAWVTWLTQWLCKSWRQQQRTISFWGQQLMASQIALSKGKSYRVLRMIKGLLSEKTFIWRYYAHMADGIGCFLNENVDSIRIPYALTPHNIWRTIQTNIDNIDWSAPWSMYWTEFISCICSYRLNKNDVNSTVLYCFQLSMHNAKQGHSIQVLVTNYFCIIVKKLIAGDHVS